MSVYTGDIGLKQRRIEDIEALADEIEAQQDLYLKGGKKKAQREKVRKWTTRLNPLAQLFGIDKAIYESDKKKAPSWLRKLVKFTGGDLETIDYGDPEAIKALETPWTSGRAMGYGKEFSKMQDELDVPYWETWLGERKEEFDTMLQLLPLIGGVAGEGGYVSPKKYYGGGSVQGGTPTISDYFSMQGKTVGGNNTQSLAEILGRK